MPRRQGRARCRFTTAGDLDHRTRKNKPNKIKQIAPFYLLPAFTNLQGIFVLQGSPKRLKSVFFFSPSPCNYITRRIKIEFPIAFRIGSPSSSALQTQPARLAKPTSLSSPATPAPTPDLPSQILFEARLWHRAYKNGAVSRPQRQAPDRKHLVALSSLFIPSFLSPHHHLSPSTSVRGKGLVVQHPAREFRAGIAAPRYHSVFGSIDLPSPRVYPRDVQGRSPRPKDGSIAAAGERERWGREGGGRETGLCSHRKTRVGKGGETANEIIKKKQSKEKPTKPQRNFVKSQLAASQL